MSSAGHPGDGRAAHSSAGHPGDGRAAHSSAGHPGDGRARHSPLAAAPRLETERLILRHARSEDVDYFAAVHADEKVMRHLGGPISREDAWRRCLTGVAFWSVLGFGLWVVERRSDGRPIGHVGFFDFHRDMQPSIEGEPEMGWVFAREAHGQGLAGEAARAARDWADATLECDSYPAIINLGNDPSMRLAERLGFERLDDAIYKGEPIAFFRRTVSR